MNAKERLQLEMEGGNSEGISLPSSPKAALDAERTQKRISMHKTQIDKENFNWWTGAQPADIASTYYRKQ